MSSSLTTALVCFISSQQYMGCVKQIWYLPPVRAAKVQVSLRIRAVLPEPPLLAHTSCESRGTFRQKARSLAPLNGWTCAVTVCHDGMLEDTNSLDGAHIIILLQMLKLTVDILFLGGFYKDRRMDRGSPRYNGGVRRETFITGVSSVKI